VGAVAVAPPPLGREILRSFSSFTVVNSPRNRIEAYWVLVWM